MPLRRVMPYTATKPTAAPIREGMNMSDVISVALQLAVIDIMKGIVISVPNLITSLGNASKEVKNDFADINRHILMEEKIKIVEGK